MKGLSIATILCLMSVGLAPAGSTDTAAAKKGTPPATGPTAPAKGTAPPAAAGTKPAAPAPTEKKTETKPSDALLKWIDTCVAQLGSSDETVRSGAQAALRLAGDAARPALEKATKGTNPGVTELAHKLLAHADRREAAAVPEAKSETPSTEVAAITQRLGLSDEQKPKVQAIVADYEQKHNAMVEDVRSGGIGRDAAKEKTKVLAGDLNAKLATVLTPDQMKRYLQERERLRPRPRPETPTE